MKILYNIVIHIMPDKIAENGQPALWFQDTERIEVVGKLGTTRRINRMIENGKEREVDDDDAYWRRVLECNTLKKVIKKLQMQLEESWGETKALKSLISNISDMVKETDKVAGWVEEE